MARLGRNKKAGISQQKEKSDKVVKKDKKVEVDDENSDSSESGDDIKWDFNEDGGQDTVEQSEDDDDGDDEEEDSGEDEEEGDEETEEKEVPSEPAVQMPQHSALSMIKNKIRRRQLYEKYLEMKRKHKKREQMKRQKERDALGENAPARMVPRTIENTREPDITMVDPDDEEVKEDEAVDELASYFRGEKEPKILVTSSDNPHSKTIKFCREFKQTIPNAEFRFRNRSSIKNMVKAASLRGYTDLVVVNEDVRKPNGILLVHLPNGPTAYFRMSSVKYCKDIKHRAKMNAMRPEVIMNNFNTRLGHTVGRMLAATFHYDPEFQGRRVVTFHNQRDYIFFRHHRYEFKNGEKVNLQEVGPRFTLRLKWLQHGTFDTKFGEYEWLIKRHEMETSRRRFFL